MAVIGYSKGSRDYVGEHFRVSEFCCKGERCGCSEVMIDESLVEILERIRSHFGTAVCISSGYRCPTHNAEVKGATRSYHMRGQAADITLENVAPEEVAKYAESIGVLGIGLYETFTHIDTRENKSFWYSSAQEYRESFGGNGKSETITQVFPTLKRGARSGSVAAVQMLLMGYGYTLSSYGADGNFGMETENAVREFQKDTALDADGIVGIRTWKKLLGIG